MTAWRRRAPAPDDERRVRFAAVFGEVYEPLQRYVHRRAAPMDADDVVAEALTVLWRRLDDVPSEHALPWTYGIARRCLANQRRGETRRTDLFERLAAQPPVVADEPPVDDALAAALATLASDDREIVRLWAWEGLPPREIGIVMSMSANAVSIRLHRAKKSLAALLNPSRVTGGVGRKDSSMDGHIEGGVTAPTPKEAR